MENSSFRITQNIFHTRYPEIVAIPCHESALSKHLDTFLGSVDDNAIGLAATYGSKGRMTALALSSRTQVLIVTLFSKGEKKTKSKKITNSPLHNLLCDSKIKKSTFYMDKLSGALFFDHGMRISNGKDLLSLSHDSRSSIAAFMTVLGNETTIVKKSVIDLFLREESHPERLKSIALQAWTACCATYLPQMLTRLEGMPSINTLNMDKQVLTIVAKTVRDMTRLIAMKPTRTKHGVEAKTEGNSIISNRYKTKISRLSGSQQLRIKTYQKNGQKRTLQTSTRVHIQGRQTKICVKGNHFSFGRIKLVETVGREDLTLGEANKATIMLSALQGRLLLQENTFVNAIWLRSATSCTAFSGAPSPAIYFPTPRSLNNSQTDAVDSIISNAADNKVVLIHGPRGTGKTTVIAAAVTSTMTSPGNDSTLWLVAQSNVAVKNIAEKLAAVAFWDFKIIVSYDFHFDWHEHLYEKIEKNVITSDDLVEDGLVGTARKLLGSRVILCTLSMLSNPKLATVTRLVPLRTVIFDEASQIEIGDVKTVFIGDDKQLAPYGTSDIPELESVFEKSHLRKRAVFLDTQYRMPIPIGAFISKNVYSCQLKSHHSINNSSCCRFIDVSDGAETSKGHSWVNEHEVKVALHIARQLLANGKSFRIITPYDAQRMLLEKSLKDANMPWKDKCFNVDSFQGNEDDYIIISVVRTAKLGFLNDMRRVNVMLTRCKVGMIICTNRVFVEDVAAETLVGKLLRSLGKSPWVDRKAILKKGAKFFV